MTEHDPATGGTPDGDDQKFTVEQLHSFQWGVAATLMPVTGGWRIHYFSVPDFDEEPGTTFPTFEAAISALQEVLPTVNTEEARATAREELEQRLHESPGLDTDGA